MSYAPRLVANAFIRKAQEHGSGLSHMKLQKLVFFAHAWYLALHDKPLLNENFEAWTYGPVAPSLYHELKGYGSNPVQSYLTQFDPSSQQIRAFVPSPEDREFWSMLDQVWTLYGSHSAIQLSDMTHTANSPWDLARNSISKVIPDESLKAYFKDLAQRYGNQSAATA